MKAFETVEIGLWTLVRQPDNRSDKWKAVSLTGRHFGYGDAKKAAIADARRNARRKINVR